MEEILSAKSPDGRWTVKVLANEEATYFEASVILDGKTVMETLETSSQTKLLSWSRRQMIEVMRRV
jgi:hypothetical protein